MFCYVMIVKEELTAAVAASAVDVMRQERCRTECRDCLQPMQRILSSACPEYFHPDHVKRELPFLQNGFSVYW